jgi:hypothetical protein
VTERNDKSGLDRSVLTYVDISCQPPGKYYLIIDESYGKALFSVDNVEVHEHEVIGTRGPFAAATVVTRFSPALVWRTVNKEDVYLQPTRVVMEREVAENKEVRAFRDQVIKDAGIETATPDGIAGLTQPTGQYL